MLFLLRRSQGRPALAAAFIAIAGFLASCGDGPTEPIISAGPPANLEIREGQDQTGTAGAELGTPLRIRVVDANGTPVAGQIVNFKVISGGGSVFAGAAITSDSGTAVERWTLGTSTADSQRVEARAVDPNTAEKLVFGTFRAIATAGAAATVSKVQGDGQTGAAGSALTDSLVVRVEDQYGNPVPGASVAWTATSGTLSANTTATNVAGQARVRWTMGAAAGTGQTTATVTGVTPVQFAATIVPGNAATISLQTPAAGAIIGSPFVTAPTVRILDAHGNAVTSPSYTVTLSVASPASVIGSATANTTDALATFSTAGLTGPAGTYTLTYTVTLGGSAQTVTQQIALTAGPASRYIVSSSAPSAAAGSAVTITAQLSDAGGAPVSTAGRVVTWSKSGAGGSFSSATSTTNSSGVATVTFTVDTLAGTTATITGTDAQNATGSTAQASVPGAAAKLAFVGQPSNTSWKIRISPAIVVAIQDQYSNTVTSATQALSLVLVNNPAAATLSGGGSTTPVNGLVTFPNVVLDAEGVGYTVRASPASGTPSSVTSIAFSVSGDGVVTSGSSVEVMVALAVDAGTVHYTKRRTDLSPGTSQTAGARHAVSITGGTSNPAGTTGFHLPGGSVIAQGGVVAHIYLTGNTTRNGGVDGPLKIAFGGNSLAGPGFLFDGTYFFAALSRWNGSASGIVRARASDGQVLRLFERFLGTMWTGGMAVGSGSVYFSDTSGSAFAIKRVSVDSGPVTTVIPGLGQIASERRTILVIGQTIYWAEIGAGTNNGSIRSAPLTGGTVTTHVTGLSNNVNSMVADATHLYVRDGNSLRRYRLTDFAGETIASNDNVADVALDAEAVYWISTGTPNTIKKRKK